VTSPTLIDADFGDIIIDSAVAWQSGDPTSITRGSLSFEPNEEWEHYDFPGKRMNRLLLTECVRSRPVVKGSMMMTGESQFLIYRPGGSWSNSASAGGIITTGIRQFTPGAMRAALSEGDYLQNFIVIWKRQRGDFIAVEFPLALCTHYGITANDGDEGLIPVEFEARQENAGTPKTSVPYLIHTLPSSFAFA
jgi:hypothetical protein